MGFPDFLYQVTASAWNLFYQISARAWGTLDYFSQSMSFVCFGVLWVEEMSENFSFYNDSGSLSSDRKFGPIPLGIHVLNTFLCIYPFRIV